MVSRRNYLIWDFDGTLGYRLGQWSGALAQVLHRFAGKQVEIEMLHPHLRTGFPWHIPSSVNPPMKAADDWWAALTPVFRDAFLACGVSPDDAGSLAGKVRSVYLDIAEWRLYEDTVPVLTELSQEGWSHVILSNHVPELSSLIAGLGLGPLIRHISNSAVTGFEKPHPGAFESIIGALEEPDAIWMIGDNIEADIIGAEAAGLRAILVRRDDPRATRRAADLHAVPGFLRR